MSGDADFRSFALKPLAALVDAAPVAPVANSAPRSARPLLPPAAATPRNLRLRAQPLAPDADVTFTHAPWRAVMSTVSFAFSLPETSAEVAADARRSVDFRTVAASANTAPLATDAAIASARARRLTGRRGGECMTGLLLSGEVGARARTGRPAVPGP